MTHKQLQSAARKHGTPLVIIDHDLIRKNYAEFRTHLPKVQVYYAVKANPAPEIVNTLYHAGASFDVASLPGYGRLSGRQQVGPLSFSMWSESRSSDRQN